MEPVTVTEIVNTTGGKLLCGDAASTVNSVSTNSREITPGCLFVPIIGDRVDAHQFIPMALQAGAAAVLTQRQDTAEDGKARIQVPDTKTALQRLAAYYRRKFRLPVVGVTGSVGKTTTKEMIAAALSAAKNVMKTSGNLNSQIGLPLTVFNIESCHDIAVIEMGMSNFGEMARLSEIALPNRAVMTNIGISHIEFLKTQQNIRAEKLHITDQFDENGVLFLNGDDSLLAELRGSTAYKTVYFGTQTWCDYRACNIEEDGKGGTGFTLCRAGAETDITIPVLGMHNVYNALAAIAVAVDAGLTIEQIQKGLSGYEGAAMRQQIHHLSKISIIDDSYNASPDSVKSSIAVLTGIKRNGRAIAVLADMMELGAQSRQAHYDLGVYAAKAGVHAVVTVGERAAAIAKGASDTDSGIITRTCGRNEEAFSIVSALLQEGDTVLVKGSRSMHTDEIVKQLLNAYQ